MADETENSVATNLHEATKAAISAVGSVGGESAVAGPLAEVEMSTVGEGDDGSGLSAAEFNEDFLRVCKGKRCKYKGAPRYTNARYCDSCGGRMRRAPILSMSSQEEIDWSAFEDASAMGVAGGSQGQPSVAEAVRRFLRGKKQAAGFVKQAGVEGITVTEVHPTSRCIHCGQFPSQHTRTGYCSPAGMYTKYTAEHDRSGYVPCDNCGFSFPGHSSDHKCPNGSGTMWTYSGTKNGTPLVVVGGGNSTSPSTSGGKAKKKGSDTFSCDADVQGCPVAPKSTDYEILIPWEMFHTWVWLAKRFDTEWIAYLKGEVQSKDGAETGMKLTSFYLPKQKANSSWCEAEDGEIQEGTIGAVHSHVGMSTFFSSTDHAHANHNIELVVNNQGSIDSSIRIKLECGRYQRVPGKIFFIGSNLQDLETELKGKLTRGYSRQGGSGYNHSSHTTYYDPGNWRE